MGGMTYKTMGSVFLESMIVITNQDDLVVKAAFPAGLLPMLSYAKPHDSNVNGKLPHSDSTAPFKISVTSILVS